MSANTQVVLALYVFVSAVFLIKFLTHWVGKKVVIVADGKTWSQWQVWSNLYFIIFSATILWPGYLFLLFFGKRKKDPDFKGYVDDEDVDDE